MVEYTLNHSRMYEKLVISKRGHSRHVLGKRYPKSVQSKSLWDLYDAHRYTVRYRGTPRISRAVMPEIGCRCNWDPRDFPQQYDFRPCWCVVASNHRSSGLELSCDKVDNLHEIVLVIHDDRTNFEQNFFIVVQDQKNNYGALFIHAESLKIADWQIIVQHCTLVKAKVLLALNGKEYMVKEKLIREVVEKLNWVEKKKVGSEPSHGPVKLWTVQTSPTIFHLFFLTPSPAQSLVWIFTPFATSLHPSWSTCRNIRTSPGPPTSP